MGTHATSSAFTESPKMTTNSTIFNTAPLVYRISAAVATLGVSKATIYRLINSGKLSRVRITEGTVGIPHASLKAYAESRGISVTK